MALTTSVIIPTYNRAHLLPSVFDCIQKQTCQPKEIIVVDDGSTDDTKLLVNKWSQKLPLHYVYQQNQGPSAAVNHGIKKASSEILAFLDTDDYWTPDKIRVFKEYFEKHPDIDACFCRTKSYLVEANGHKKLTGTHPPLMYCQYGDLFEMLFVRTFLSRVIVEVKRERVAEVGGFSKEFKKFGEDWEFFLRVFQNRKVSFINQILAEKTILQDSLSVVVSKNLHAEVISGYEHIWKEFSSCVTKKARNVFQKELSYLKRMIQERGEFKIDTGKDLEKIVDRYWLNKLVRGEL